jgi:hypothetical protein
LNFFLLVRFPLSLIITFFTFELFSKGLFMLGSSFFGIELTEEFLFHFQSPGIRQLVLWPLSFPGEGLGELQLILKIGGVVLTGIYLLLSCKLWGLLKT